VTDTETLLTRRGRALTPRLQRSSIIAAGFGQNLVLTTVTTFILVYLLEYAHISVQGMAVVTIIITVAKLADAVSDPVMGSVVDMTHTRWGKMRPYILFSTVPVAVLSTLLFAIPDVPEPGKLVFFGVCYFLWGFAYTVCDVPFWGLIGSAFPDPRERTGVVARVRAFGGISLGLATLGLPWLALALSFSPQTTAAGWTLAVAAASVIGMGLFVLAFFNTRERARGDRERLGFRQLFTTLFKNTPLLMVLLGSVLGFGRNMVQAGGAVFVVIAYGSEGYFTLIGASVIVGMVLASFLCPLVLRVMTGKSLILWSSLVAAVFYVLMYVAGFENIVAVVAFIFLTGLSLGIFVVVQTTMIADAVDDIERRTGIRNDGISFSTLTFVSKVMSALAVLVFGAIIVIAGYQAGVTVTPQMQNIVFIGLTLVPAASCLVSAVPFLFYRLRTPVHTS